MKRMLSILLMLMLVPCAALAEEDDEPVTPMYELTMAKHEHQQDGQHSFHGDSPPFILFPDSPAPSACTFSLLASVHST